MVSPPPPRLVLPGRIEWEIIELLTKYPLQVSPERISLSLSLYIYIYAFSKNTRRMIHSMPSIKNRNMFDSLAKTI